MNRLTFQILDWLSGGYLTKLRYDAHNAKQLSATRLALNEDLRRQLYVARAELHETRQELDAAREQLGRARAQLGDVGVSFVSGPSPGIPIC